MTFTFENAFISRRLPVYLLLDTSGSMAGAPLQAVEQGVKLVCEELMNTPQAVETAWISVITFGSQASQIVVLTELMLFTPPHLQAGGSTAMGAALHMLGEAIDQEVAANTSEQKGDYKPLIFLFTDGAPTDDWETGLSALRSRTQKKPVTLVGLGCGAGAKISTLQQICDVTLKLADATPDAIQEFFKWVSQSIKTASITVPGSGGQGPGANLPPLSPNLQIPI